MKQQAKVSSAPRPSWFRHACKALPVMIASGMLMTAMPAMAHGDAHAALAYQQDGKVTGRIVDAEGEPVVGAVVTLKGTGTRVVTDIDGNYAINARPGQTLVVTSLGMKPMEIQAGQQSEATMEDDSSTLREMVVIGYGAVKKADLAGSVAVMNDKAFKDQPITDVSQALQGRMAGVNVVQSGVPGGSVKIRVRGIGSINRSNEPLYVVDGIVRESGMEGLNTEDIASIQVLKDASSTAIYGSRGANGVVLIQTKTGKAGVKRVTFDAALGVSNAYRMPKVMGTRQYAQALLDGGKVTNQAELQPYLDGSNAGIDWMDEVLRTGVTQNYKVVITQGNKDTQYYISGNYMKHRGVVDNTQYERYQAKANIQSHLYDWLDVTADMQYSHGKGVGGGFGMSQQNPLWIAMNYSPTMNMFDELGKYSHDPYNAIEPNPVGLLKGNASQGRSDIFNGHIDLKFNILPGLTFTTTNGVDYYDHKGYNFGSSRVYSQSSMGNSDGQRTMLQTTNNLTYTGAWGDHYLTATAVYEASQSTTRNMSISGTNLQEESVGWWNVNNASVIKANNGYSHWSMVSWVGRAMYNYADRYLLTATFRADGSSRFSKDKWGYFPSIAAAWTVTNEDFMKNITWLSNLKIRASYGLIGNQDISPYSTLGMLTFTSFDFGTSTQYPGYWPNSVATPELTWEKTRQFDLGLDFGFLNNRIEVAFDYYHKKTTDALLASQLADYLGGTGFWTNAGEIKNSGIDLSLTARVIQTPELNWTTTLNGSYNKNEVVKLTALQPILYGDVPMAGTMTEGATIVKEGEAIGTFYGYKWAGLNANGLDSYYDKDGNGTTTPNADDRQVLGCSNPDFTLGWNNTVTYKNWEFNAFFNAAFGAQRLNLVRYAMNSMFGASRFVTDATYLDEVGKTMPRLDAIGNNNLGNSSKWIENADYLRCENISVAYTLPRSLTRFVDIRLSLSAQNLFTITGYKGIDPVGMAFGNKMDVDNGIDMGAYPNPRTFTFGVRFNF